MVNKKKKYLTTGEVREIVRISQTSNATLQEIADQFGCCERQVSRIRHDHKIQKPARTLLTDQEKAAALKLLIDGCSYSEAGRTIGRSPSAIRRHFPGYGWPQSGAGHFWRLSKKLEAI